MPIVHVTFPNDRSDAYSLSTDHAITKRSDGLITSFVLQSRSGDLHLVILSYKGNDLATRYSYIESAVATFTGAGGGAGGGGRLGLMKNAKLGKVGTIVGGLFGGLFTLVGDFIYQQNQQSQQKIDFRNYAYFTSDTKQLIYDGLIYSNDVNLVDDSVAEYEP